METERTVPTMWLVGWVWVVFTSLLAVGLVWGDDDPNGPQGASTVVSGETSGNSSSCWQEVFSRDGRDGGQLTIELDTCEIIIYTILTMAQNDGAGATADLEKDDLIVVWDEDAEHGENEQYKNFTFTDDAYVADPNYPYINLITTDSRTNWAIYRVTADGTFTKGFDGTNEHELVQMRRNEIEFDKDDGISSCVSPGDEITYTICWDNDGINTFPDCFIVDWLPKDVIYPGGSWTLDPNLNPVPPDPSYDPNTHSYVYLDIGDIAVGDANCVELTVVVNGTAEPGSNLHNVADLYSDETLIARATEDTPVCCWDDTDPNIIYVDWTAEGNHNGTDWENAYTDLADALSRAANSNCAGAYTIYVAQGIYDPNKTPELTFALPEGCRVYGGFPTGGSVFSARDPKQYETILTGLIDGDGFPDVDTLVTMGDETLLDGFTVEYADFGGQGIYGSGVDFTVENCTIKESYGYGIYAENGNIAVKWCKVQLNDRDGIRHDGAGYTLTVDNSWILRNGEKGIYTINSTPTLKNSTVSESNLKEYANAGIRIEDPTSQPVLYNNTIANNKAEGIYFEDDRTLTNPNDKDWPDIQNCIVYYNNSGGGDQLAGMDADVVANYSCIQDCNEVNNNHNDEPEFAYTVDPNGTPDPENYHLASDSFCKEKGNPNHDTDDVGLDDMDNESRIAGTHVDIGADEVDCGDVANEVDWNADGLVNMYEYSKFSDAWLSHDPNDPGLPYTPDPNWNPDCNLDATVDTDTEYEIDMADLIVFWNDWLWKACWKDSGLYESMGMGGGGESMSMMAFESAAVEPVEETDSYAEMSTAEVVSLVVGIHEVLDSIEVSIAEGHENAESLIEAKEFLEDVLADIKASRGVNP